jgi:hypothetical protein
MTASFSGYGRPFGNSGASPTEVQGATGSGDLFAEFYARQFQLWTSVVEAAFPEYVPTAGTPSVSNSAGLKSKAQLDFEYRRERLIAAVLEMKRSAPNWSGIASVVRAESADSAVSFLNSLPGDAILPRVAPDGEGDVIFVWDPANGNCVVTVEKRLLHLAAKLGTDAELHVVPQQFLGFSIPSSILKHIPRK